MTTPVIFVHGLWLHSSSWQAWADLYSEAGYQTATPEWPGVADTLEETRAHPERQAGKGLAEIIKHHADYLKTFDSKPILIGHSFGGLIVQSLLGQGLAAAAIAVDPAQIRGVLPLPIPQLRSALPVLGNPLNFGKTFRPNLDQFAYGFGNALPRAESDDLHEQWTIPSPCRPLFEAALANFNPKSPAKVNVKNSARGPLLIISGTQDHTVPDAVSKAAYKLYRHSSAVTEFKQFDRGHSLTVDHGWREIAQAGLDWLKSQGH
ncbi:alpha/beta hydrolase [Jatrophihabitans telluris]|uniref:Alpha/beta hydrolase n=1 Tax=Jatrophihabitans telluris TaxID=2038343 RepID=A0ABY4QYB6_9ACTN|nr:alpha/beta hydrolase [Jatrophihabitans telluris]UQX88277.1 alpha/beta hydrolase [Jatrophihabitans telluris]